MLQTLNFESAIQAFGWPRLRPSRSEEPEHPRPGWNCHLALFDNCLHSIQVLLSSNRP